jgi:hypothetical protein
MTVGVDGTRGPSLAAEIVGWLGFLIFVVATWLLRQALDRWKREDRS